MKNKALVNAIASGAISIGESISLEQTRKLALLVKELIHWNRQINLTSIQNIDGIVDLHILDSMVIRSFLNGSRILDVGTGAGFPGLPLAIIEPDIYFELIDSNGKKIGFVNHIINELDLKNAVGVKSRSENYIPAEGFDTLIARALSNVCNFISIAGHLVKSDGVMLALKGKRPNKELEQIPTDWKHRVIELRVPYLKAGSRHLIELKQRVY